MFEKEAKKHKEEFITAYISVGGGMKAADMIGAQKEQSYQEGAEFGYNKVNEWHYLQDNPSDLPKNREKVLLLVKLNDKWNRTEVLIGYRDFGDCLGEYCKDWGYFEPIKNIFYDFVDGEEVIAWKEIVPPKEIKDN